MSNVEKVLDKGYIEVVDVLGDDLTPVNAARVSFGGRSKEFTDKDRRLSKFLIKHKHFSPFRHQHVMMIIKAPEFVMRQWYKHVVGIETTSDHPTKDHAWNEISGRYVEYSDFYIPENFRAQSSDNKQASEGLVEDQESAEKLWSDAQQKSIEAYEKMIEMGMAKEQARAVLPEGITPSRLYMAGTIRSWIHFVKLRSGNGTQLEHSRVAVECAEALSDIFPMIVEFVDGAYVPE